MSVAAAAVVVGRREGGQRCGCEVWGVGEYRDVGVGEGQELGGGYRRLELKLLGKGSEYSRRWLSFTRCDRWKNKTSTKEQEQAETKSVSAAGRITAWSWGSGRVGRSRENRSWE